MQQGTATRLVIVFLVVFPLDALFISRNLVAGTVNVGLYAALLAAVHFLLIVTVLRLYSATTDRDAMFLAMLSFASVLASAVFTVDTNFFFLFIAYLLFAVATFLAGDPPQRFRRSVSPAARRSLAGTSLLPGHLAGRAERGIRRNLFRFAVIFLFSPRERRLFRAHRLSSPL